MLDTKDTRTRLLTFPDSIGGRHHRQMNPTGMANKPEQKPLGRTERHSYRQWAGSRDKILSPPVEAELFFLTSLFIELIGTDFGEQTAQACAKACFRQLRGNVFSPGVGWLLLMLPFSGLIETFPSTVKTSSRLLLLNPLIVPQ